jgi:hypothetical protein
MPNSGLREPFSRTYCSDDIPDLRRAPVAQWAATRLPAGPSDPESATDGIAVESSSTQIRSPCLFSVTPPHSGRDHCLPHSQIFFGWRHPAPGEERWRWEARGPQNPLQGFEVLVAQMGQIGFCINLDRLGGFAVAPIKGFARPKREPPPGLSGPS